MTKTHKPQVLFSRKLVKLSIQNLFTKEFILYLTNGALTALLYAGISSLLVLISDLPIWLIVLISNIFILFFHFIGSHFVFGLHLKSADAGRTIRYLLSVGINWGLNIACAQAIFAITQVEILATLFSPVIPTLLNFPILRLFVFRSSKEKLV